MSPDPQHSFSIDHAKVAVIVAGGQGLRMQTDTPKQFLEMEGRPVLLYTVDTFLHSYPDMQVVLVLPEDHLQLGKDMLTSLPGTDRIQFVTGGETRFHSVRNGLSAVKKPSIVFVHDAVRCLLSVSLIHRCYEQAVQLGSAIPTIGATDSIRMIDAEQSRSLPRNSIRLVQTPQTFRSDILLPAYETEYRSEFTDEASVVEYTGLPVHLIEGEEQNLKITRPIDLVIAAEYLREKTSGI